MAKKSAVKEAAEPAKAAAEEKAPETPVETVAPTAAPMKAVHEANVIRPTSTSKACHETVHVKACRNMLFGDLPVI